MKTIVILARFVVILIVALVLLRFIG